MNVYSITAYAWLHVKSELFFFPRLCTFFPPPQVQSKILSPMGTINLCRSGYYHVPIKKITRFGLNPDIVFVIVFFTNYGRLNNYLFAEKKTPFFPHFKHQIVIIIIKIWDWLHELKYCGMCYSNRNIMKKYTHARTRTHSHIDIIIIIISRRDEFKTSFAARITSTGAYIG